MKKSKRSKASKHKNGVDRISNLPDPILHSILSSLPTTEEVVRTSILSTRWRYLWTSVPSLNIDCTRGLKPSQNFKKNKFKEFVYWVLLNKTLDLESFHLCCGNYYNLSTVGRWIHAAVTRKVKSIHLRFSSRVKDEVIDLPYSLVTCDSLEELRLFLFKRTLSVPTFTGFPALRVLELSNVELTDGDSVKNFFENCPLLEELRLIDLVLTSVVDLCISCSNLKTLVIDNRDLDHGYYENEGLCQESLEISCPKLVYLEYAGHTAYNFSFENLDSLKKAVIYPEAMAQKELSFESFGDTICELFGFLSHVESLSINLFFIQSLDAARDPYEDYPESLPNLKTLEVSTTIDNYTMTAFMRILKCSPNLESLYLTVLEEIFWKEEWELDEVLPLHLKRVEFVVFSGEKRKLDMARFLLEHGNELEEMVFSWGDKAIYDEKSTEFMKEVLSFNKASSTVKLVSVLKECQPLGF